MIDPDDLMKEIRDDGVLSGYWVDYIGGIVRKLKEGNREKQFYKVRSETQAPGEDSFEVCMVQEDGHQ